GIRLYDWGEDVLFEQDQLPAALRVLNATATYSKTDYENLLKLVFTFAGAKTQKAARSIETDPKLAAARAAYIDACRSRNKAQIDACWAQLKKSRDALRPLGAQLVALTRDKELANRSEAEII